MDFAWAWICKQALLLTGHDAVIIVATVVIMWATRMGKTMGIRMAVLEKHRTKTEAIIIALPFMTVSTGVWYTDDTRNGDYKPKFTCVYRETLQEKHTDDKAKAT